MAIAAKHQGPHPLDIRLVCCHLKKFAQVWVPCEIRTLVQDTCKVCCYGLLPTKKTSLALVALHGKKQINFTAKNCSDWADEMGATLRCTFGKYRELAFGRNHAEQYRITMGNASEGDRKLIDEATLMVHKPLQHIAAHITQHPKPFQIKSPMDKHDQTHICIPKSTVQHHTKHLSYLLINTATHEHTCTQTDVQHNVHDIPCSVSKQCHTLPYTSAHFHYSPVAP